MQKGDLFVNHANRQKWLSVLYFLTSGFVFLGCVWYLWAGVTNPEYYWHSASSQADGVTDQIPGPQKRVMLAKDQGASVDKERIVYRGRHNGRLQLDLFILQLDPHYGYPYLVEEDEARRGFQIGSHQFRVLAVSDEKISLKLL